ncbi:MAG: 6-carboxytetrahydropterin synthase [Desulfovibrio sp.]|nr:6-carboxytetrahydropterin synthase [Desulfovibrio sp.]
MISVTREHVIAAAHRLYDYNGRCERLHGHNYRIALTLDAPGLDALGMVADFSVIKKVLFAALDEEWDHRTLLYVKDPLCARLAAILDDGSIRPVPFNPTAENMAAWLGETFFPAVLRHAGMDAGVRPAAVRVHETDGSCALWSRD